MEVGWRHSKNRYGKSTGMERMRSVTGLDERSGNPRWSPGGSRIAFDDIPELYGQI
jgi:hypothetical protein